MKKPRKVKRYGSIYNQRRRRRQLIIKIILGVVALLLIAGAVFFLALGLFGDSDEMATAPQPTTSETSDTEVQDDVQTAVIATELPINLVGSPSKISDFAVNAKADGYTAIVVPMKTSEGEILYDSQVPEATTWGAISKATTDVDEVISAIEEQGLIPIAELSAFEDDMASTAKYENSYCYTNETTATYLFGGKNGISWLNPYQDSAREYICNLSKELYEIGFQEIWLNGVQFPPQGITSKVGTNANGISQDEILKTFISEMEQTGVPFVISYSWDAVGGGQEAMTLYGGDPTTYGASKLSPILDSSASAEELKSTLEQTEEQAPEATIIPSIPASMDLNQITGVLQEVGIDSYLVLAQ